VVWTPPANPELEHVAEVAERTAAAQSGAEGELAGTVYVTTAVPNLRVRVLPGRNVSVPEGHEVGVPGNYFEGAEFETHGPTAHMLEARGFVQVIGVAE
jgi:hypothetical protein